MCGANTPPWTTLSASGAPRDKKAAIRDLLRERGIDLEAMKAEQNMADVDDFDFICHVAFDKKPLTRRERANNVKKRDFLSRYSGAAREVLEALLDKYMNTGIYEIEKTEILQTGPLYEDGQARQDRQLLRRARTAISRQSRNWSTKSIWTRLYNS